MTILLALHPTTLLLGGVVLLCLLWWLSTRRPPGLPPGPGLALPLLGHLHLMPKDPRSQFWAWRRQYGDVFSLYMGGKLVVVLASYSAIREALVTFADVFSDRPHGSLLGQITNNKGISSTSGPQWREQRKTALEILRHMGMGKNVLAEKIQQEISHYVQAIKNHQGAPVDLAKITKASISNNICSILYGKRFDYQDPEFLRQLEMFERTVSLIAGTAILNFFPVLGYIPGDPFGGQEAKANNAHFYRFVRKRVAEHRAEKKGKVQENTDFIDSYLQQMELHKTRGDVNTFLNEEELERCATDLFGGGTETTSTVILWTLLFFLHYPDVQDKCFKEISDVIGPHHSPTMSDKLKLPYLDATIQEVLRKSDLVPLSLMHATARDCTFRGYVIPKGAMIIPALTCSLMDPDIWGDPDNFRPERFIGSDGKVTRSEELIAFGIGRRACPGEPLGRMELFLYLATLIQHFRFLPQEEGPLPSLKGIFALTHVPHPYKIRAVPRM